MLMKHPIVLRQILLVLVHYPRLRLKDNTTTCQSRALHDASDTGTDNYLSV